MGALLFDKLTAGQVIKALQAKHADCLTMSEATILVDHGTENFNERRMDFWAMQAPPVKHQSWGYEVKVSRSDFLSDKKFPSYIPYCTRFFFACPWGMIQPAELDKGVGLLWVRFNGETRMKKRSAIFNVKIENQEHMIRRWALKRHWTDVNKIIEAQRARFDSIVRSG